VGVDIYVKPILKAVSGRKGWCRRHRGILKVWFEKWLVAPNSIRSRWRNLSYWMSEQHCDGDLVRPCRVEGGGPFMQNGSKSDGGKGMIKDPGPGSPTDWQAVANA